MSSKVYFIKASVSDGEQLLSDKAVKLFNAAGFENCFTENDFTAVKVHVGEAGNTTYIKAPYIKGLVEKLLSLKTKPFLTDTNALYSGLRHNAIDHHITAAEHGFSLETLGIPFIVPDGINGTAEAAVQVNGQINKEVFIAYGIAKCQSILSIAHFTGHMATCAAATLKTLGMGCASQKGKMLQHAALTLTIGDNCKRCGECFKHCPADAITIDDVKAHINQEKCISCAECLAVCRFSVVQYNWGEEDETLQKSMAEHALGVLKGKTHKASFFNYLISITKDCDCFDTPDMPTVVDDIGIVASTDPVAVDKAAIDLVEEKAGKKLPQLVKYEKIKPQYQLEHAQRIGLGTINYQLKEVKYKQTK
ncbi:MAG: DUF362 domain-containing protein [Planctomycetota bacterium]|nr:MAG: DUF362 domain-containing protein [Planctomycetota bacterium]